MGRKRQQRSLAVWMNHERVATWQINPQGVHSLSYHPSWIDSAAARPLSLSLPLAKQTISGPVVERFFDNLLPDNIDIRQRIQANFGVPSNSAFDLLAEIGRDCIGAVQLLPEGSTPETKDIQAFRLSEKAVAARIRELPKARGGLAGNSDDFRISLAGAQEKLALLNCNGIWYRPVGSTPTTHILKLPLGRFGVNDIDMSQSVYNELFCGELLRAFGLPVANSEIQTFEDQTVLVVERFDRQWHNDQLIRLPQEDCCQALGVASGLKYQADGGPGMADMMALLQNSQTPLQDRRQFFKAQLLFYCLGAIDGHAKNFSLFLKRQGQFQLTPLYDVMSVYPVMGTKAGQIALQKVKMAMAVYGQTPHYKWQEIKARHWQSTAKRCGFDGQLQGVVEEITQQAESAITQTQRLLPQDFPAEVAESIVAGFRSGLSKLAAI
ncbi:MAG: type II toxin-antitoxin system HipA family toxin [Gammaproteobacteria bacterium]|nr:type II toxin-antitoxin system HipA family toxin [Gammaproteobacteria bacterium]